MMERGMSSTSLERTPRMVISMKMKPAAVGRGCQGVLRVGCELGRAGRQADCPPGLGAAQRAGRHRAPRCAACACPARLRERRWCVPAVTTRPLTLDEHGRQRGVVGHAAGAHEADHGVGAARWGGAAQEAQSGQTVGDARWHKLESKGRRGGLAWATAGQESGASTAAATCWLPSAPSQVCVQAHGRADGQGQVANDAHQEVADDTGGCAAVGRQRVGATSRSAIDCGASASAQADLRACTSICDNALPSLSTSLHMRGPPSTHSHPHPPTHTHSTTHQRWRR